MSSTGYEGVMRLAQNQFTFGPIVVIDWLKVVKGCYEEAKSHGGNRFAGRWVYKRQEVGFFPGLRRLVTYDIVKKVDKTIKLTFYVMPDIEGVARALRELGYLA